MKARPSQRLTVAPLSSLSTNEASRVFFTQWPTSSRAWSQPMSSQWSEPGRRTCGLTRRRGLRMSCSSEAPLGQSVPRLIGWSGSPSTCTTCEVAFLALSPSVWMMTPQLTEQYGQVERVSVVRAIFKACVCARTDDRLKPKAETAAPPAIVLLMKVLRSMPFHSYEGRGRQWGRVVGGCGRCGGGRYRLAAGTSFYLSRPESLCLTRARVKGQF